MYFPILLSALWLQTVPVAAFWRLPCVTPIVQERADPIVNPGAISGHLHTIMGGNAFDFNMSYASTQTSSCSSCTVQGDFSNYWTPVLFYQYPNGTFQKVNQVGGVLVYYIQRNATGEDIKAFPPGFRMVAGDPFKRVGGDDMASQAVSYHCLDYNGPPRAETENFPTDNCPDGLRSQVFFPSCWDGTNLDAPDHKSHMSYPLNQYNAGVCPSSHPVRTISLFYEIIWDTNAFKDMWYGSSQPFVWSMGDPTGYGFHGDFLNGWRGDLLQNAVDTCTNLSGRVEDCPLFNLSPDSTAQGCSVPDRIGEDTSGLLTSMPGCNPVQPGPSRATPATTCSPSSTASIHPASQSQYFTDLTSQGWAYLGCATDSVYNRSMSSTSASIDTMSNEVCTSFCQAKGYSYAATEWSRECYCANTFPWDRMPIKGIVGSCNMKCSGAVGELCGGSQTMSLYRKCNASETCQNADLGVPGSGTSTDSGTSAHVDSVGSSSSSSSSTTNSITTTTGLKQSTTSSTSTLTSSSTSSSTKTTSTSLKKTTTTTTITSKSTTTKSTNKPTTTTTKTKTTTTTTTSRKRARRSTETAAAAPINSKRNIDAEQNNYAGHMQPRQEFEAELNLNLVHRRRHIHRKRGRRAVPQDSD